MLIPLLFSRLLKSLRRCGLKLMSGIIEFPSAHISNRNSLHISDRNSSHISDRNSARLSHKVCFLWCHTRALTQSKTKFYERKKINLSIRTNQPNMNRRKENPPKIINFDNKSFIYALHFTCIGQWVGPGFELAYCVASRLASLL